MATPATTNETIRKAIFMGALFLSNKLIYVMNKKITGFEASGIYNLLIVFMFALWKFPMKLLCFFHIKLVGSEKI